MAKGRSAQLSGHVRVYAWSGTAWLQLGGDVDGEAADDRSGHSVSLSADGKRLAIGAPKNDGNGSKSGHVRVYRWSGTAWLQLGGDIDGEAADDQFGHSVSLSANGSRFLQNTPDPLILSMSPSRSLTPRQSLLFMGERIQKKVTQINSSTLDYRLD